MIIMCSVPISQGVAEEAVIVLEIGMMNLDPDTRHVDCVDVCRKASMRVINVLTDVPDAFYDISTVFVCFLQIAIAEIGLVDFAE